MKCVLSIRLGRVEIDGRNRHSAWVHFGKGKAARYWLEPGITLCETKGELRPLEVKAGFAVLKAARENDV